MSESPPPLPVICDRCRAEGLAGGDPFEAFGDLLAFDPVPRRKHRPDGWDATRQRAFIAALSLTGSVRAAARAVDKATFGVDQLLASPGCEGFRAAMDEAFAMAADERSRRIAESLRAVAAEQFDWRPPAPPWAKAASRGPASGNSRAAGAGRDRPSQWEEMTAEQRHALTDKVLEAIIKPYALRLRMEREERLAGRIVAADFYLRQITFMEVLLDIVSDDALRLLQEFRHRKVGLQDIAQTPMSRMLDATRRDFWHSIGEPVGPEHPPRDRLVEHDGFSTEPLEYLWPDQALSRREQEAAYEERHKQDAQAQVEWEAEARRDYERRRESDAARNPGEPPAAASGSAGGEQGKAGQPR